MKIIDSIGKNRIKALLDKEKINLPQLLKRLTGKKYIIIICGPTGIGKSRIVISLAMMLDTNIISADSMQVYKNMDIGTDKLDTSKYGIKQFMTDIYDPDHRLSVVEFKDECREIIKKEFFAKKKVPVMIGGSGMYIKAVIDDIDKIPGEDKTIRKRLEEEIKKHGLENQYKKLKDVDSDYAGKISNNDKKRIIRALEVYETGGIPFSRYQKKWKGGKSIYNTIFIGLNMGRAALYKKIENRVDMMIKEGLVDEVRELVGSGYKESYSLSQAVGYKELISYLDGYMGLDESIEGIKKNTRRLAKKQLTWFRPDGRINWISLDSYDNIFVLMVEIFKILYKGSKDGKN